ncbi:hypothetical protein HNR42_001214 [Deinobacterium chartae]|uniref:ATPase AAA-type core domain-containing protein n=1 Tax=Deinobacterium chartae TaxID=521158 RepID=A0A841HW79_9DEIO|nr:AAA family ATPase [Deinobacterium chartae]MBB6097791.1 hypothetical protein [Deinobacterium chartae]
MNLRTATQMIEMYLGTPGAPALMLWGPPGVGKSTAVRAVAERHHYQLVDLRLSQLSPVDLRGLPTVDREKMASRWLRPIFLPSEEDVRYLMSEQGGAYRGLILLLDEVNTAPVQTQAAAFQLVLDRAAGEYVLPQVEGFPIFLILAGNRASDRSVVHQMPAPLMNRMGHLEVEADAESFCQYGLERGLDPRVLGFIAYGGTEKLLRLPQAAERSFPTPRTWEFVSTMIRGRPWSVELQQLVATLVGEGAAHELGAFIELQARLPDLDAVLAGQIPEGMERESVAVQWSYVTALTARVMSLGDALGDEQVTHWVRALSRLQPEYANLGLSLPLRGDLSRMRRFIANAEYKAWNARNVALLV